MGKDKIKVLIVEDSKSILNYMKEILSKEAEIYTAGNGKEALEIFEREKIDVIFSDVCMPEINGLELLKKIREKNGDIPFVLLSQFNDIDNVSKAVEYGISYFLPKPFDEKKLLNLFNKAIKNLETSKKLKETQSILSQYKKAIDESIIVSKTDPNGIITYANDLFCKISGYTRDELIGKPHNIIRDENVPKEVFKNMWQTIKSKKIWKGIISNKRKDGSKYIVKTTIVPILDEKGNIIEYIAFREDITEIVKKDEKLQAEKNKLYKILDNMDNIVGLSNQNKKVTFINKSFFELFGFKNLNDFLEKFESVADLFVKENGFLQKNINGEFWVDYVLRNQNKIHKAVMIDKENKRRIFEVRIKELKEEDEKFYLFTLNDITEIDTLRQKAEELAKAKAEFLANMSHEIRTPMNAILGFTKLLEKTDSPEKQKKYLEIVNKSANSLLGIINDVLDFSKLQSGKMQLDLTNINPFEEFARIVILFMARAKEKNINLETDLDLNIPECLKLDPIRIQQVLSNLIGNAIKFTPEGGKVVLYARMIEKKGNRAKIKIGVKDTGIGIPKEAQNKIFDAFSQADSSTTRKFGGTGLGLAICSKLVSLMGGKLKVESEEGKGSDFFFEGEFEICKPRYSLKELFKSLNVVIVNDDNNPVLEKIEKYFKTMDISYKTVSSKDASAYLNPENVFILFCNYRKFLDELIKRGIPAVIICENAEENRDEINIKILKDADNVSALYNDLLEIGIMKNSVKEKEELKKSYTGNILIAEDNEVNQMLIKELLKEYGLHPVIAENGQEAIKKGMENRYDLILMDVSMPEMNGIEAMKTLKQKGLKVPIVALTANAMEGDKEYFLKEGFDDYLSKPIVMEDLERILNKYLGIKKKNHLKNGTENEKYVDFSLIKKELPLSDEFLFKVFRTFLDSYPKIIKELEEAIEKEDFERIYNLAHKLKGSAANIRLKAVVKTAEEIEKAAKERKIIDYKTYFNQLKLILKKSKKELEEIMKK